MTHPLIDRLVRGKFRIYAGWLAILIILATVDQPPHIIGILIALTGAALRTWSAGCIHKDQQLSQDGPYALCRNPLYLGSFLILIGIAIMVRSWIVLVLASTFFIAIYNHTIQGEEEKLARLFPIDFPNYLSRSPRFFPSPRSFARALRTTHMAGFSLHQAIRHTEYNSWIGIALFTLVQIAIVMWIRPLFS